jgi:hypothetical protein
MMKVNLSLDSTQPLDPIIASYHKQYDGIAKEFIAAVKAGNTIAVTRLIGEMNWHDIRLQRDWEDLQFFKQIQV